MEADEKRRKPYRSLSLLDFQEQFPSEKSCWEYLIQMRWPEGFSCPKCKSKSACLNPKRKVFECYSCRAQTSVTTGTIFHKSRVPLRKWFWAVFIMATSKKGTSMLYLQRQLGIRSYRAAWLMGHKIRAAMIQRDKLYKLKGQAQVDEIFVGGKQSWKDKRKNGTNKSLFMIAVEESKEGKPHFVAFRDIGAPGIWGIQDALESMVEKGIRLKADGNVSYKRAKQDLKELELKLNQVTASKNPEKAAKHLRWANTLTSNLKRFLLSTYHGVKPDYHQAYLAEFAYRFNRRYWPQEAFDRLLYACLNATPVSLPELKA